MQNLKYTNLALAMQNAKSDRMVKPAPPAEEKVVLMIDSLMFNNLSATGWVRLRMACKDGNSVILNLKNKDLERVGNDEYKDWFLTLPVEREGLLNCINRRLEFVFYNEEQQRAAHFRIAAVSQDFWFGDMKPICERLQ